MLVFLIIVLTGHPKAADEFLKAASFTVSGMAGATWWAGCC